MSPSEAVIAQTTIIRVETQLPFHLALLSGSSFFFFFFKKGLVAFVTFWLLECSFLRNLSGDLEFSGYSPTEGIRQSKVIDVYHGPGCSALAGCVVSYCPMERIMMPACYHEDDEWTRGAQLNNIAQHETWLNWIFYFFKHLHQHNWNAPHTTHT